MNYQTFWQQLTSIYETGEAKAVARYVYEHTFGLSTADVLCGKDALLTASQQQQLQQIGQRLLRGEPVQYVTGIAEFGPLRLHVEPGVLIPRPETHELCQLIAKEMLTSHPSFLDIGTGSGCIAITLALRCPQAAVTAWDISGDALRVARQNAEQLGADVTFEKHDILRKSEALRMRNEEWDLIVSNPPYICYSEAAAMHANVLGHEPHTALFVPDDDPLLFYRHIARYAARTLNAHGQLYFEINPLYHDLLLQLLAAEGFHHMASHPDQFGKTRFVRAVLAPMKNTVTHHAQEKNG